MYVYIYIIYNVFIYIHIYIKYIYICCIYITLEQSYIPAVSRFDIINFRYDLLDFSVCVSLQ